MAFLFLGTSVLLSVSMSSPILDCSYDINVFPQGLLTSALIFECQTFVGFVVVVVTVLFLYF